MHNAVARGLRRSRRREGRRHRRSGALHVRSEGARVQGRRHARRVSRRRRWRRCARSTPRRSTRAPKREIVPGLEPGSELGWADLGRPAAARHRHRSFQVRRLQGPELGLSDAQLRHATSRAERIDGGTINALDPNLQPFFDRGGKLLQYHGWSDPQISPRQQHRSITSASRETLGGRDKVQRFVSPVHGARHGALRRRRRAEQLRHGRRARAVGGKGQAPERIVASRVRDGTIDRTRPLCPYPQVATFKGTGSTADAANFVCRVTGGQTSRGNPARGIETRTVEGAMATNSKFLILNS